MQIGRAIRSFTNHYAESWEAVELVEPVGQEAKKPPRAIPTALLTSLKAYVLERLVPYGSKAEHAKTKE